LQNNFKYNIALDISTSQIEKLKENIKKLNEKEKDIKLKASNEKIIINDDIYNIHKYIPQDIKFDLITIGQAFHWFNDNQLIEFIKKILKPNGTFIIIGYKKQHFKNDNGDYLYDIFQEFIDFIKPFFECDADETDNAYPNSKQLFKDNFEINDTFFNEEKIEIELETLEAFVASWSAYVNYKKLGKSENEDPLIKLKEKFLNVLSNKEIKKIDFYNFYFLIKLKGIK
jgi:SAM-dependent methyltransferase